MNPLIKWPGGKSREINKIEKIIPKHNRYIEPFFGGGALFFYLKPQTAIINDVSKALINFYNLIKKQDKLLHDLLLCYNESFLNLIKTCNENYDFIYKYYNLFSEEKITKKELISKVNDFNVNLTEKKNLIFNDKIILDKKEFIDHLNKMVTDKIQRTVKNNVKQKFNNEDLKNNLITGFTSGFYMYFRKIFNDINLHRISSTSTQYNAANFYFIREFCYGSMFRYNNNGEFNIPYGGMSYNKKNLSTKIINMFNKNVETIFKGTDIHCDDFERFFKNANLKHDDFIFLDPPYDTDFSDYEGIDFTKHDQERLANSLKNICAKFILVIKNTEFIHNLYKNYFNVLTFDNQYTYNVRSRNERSVEHLIITNIDVK